MSNRGILFIGFCYLVIAMLYNLHTVPFPFEQIDEHAHYSYAQYLRIHHRWWPDFNNFPMFANPAEPNYLPHPPVFYWPMKFITGDYFRAFGIGCGIAMFALYAWLGHLLKLPRMATIYYIFFPVILFLSLQVGFYSNDAWSMLGGSAVCVGSLLWMQQRRGGIAFMLIGLLLASVKLTSFMLTSFYLLFFWLQYRRPIPLKTTAFVFLLALLPYMYFFHQYGSPAPTTPGQHYMLEHVAKAFGWYDAPRASFLIWLPMTLVNFADQFGGVEFTAIPILALVVGWALLLPKPSTEPLLILARASGFATLIMLIIHLTFSYQRYLDYGWISDSLLRYYFPLIPAYGATVVALYLHLREKRPFMRDPQ